MIGTLPLDYPTGIVELGFLNLWSFAACAWHEGPDQKVGHKVVGGRKFWGHVWSGTS